nr:hypothetical protein [Bacteroidota bacterium]
MGGYNYLWNDGNTSQNRAGLGASSYRVTATDANGCVSNIEQLILTQPERTDWTITGNANTNPGTQFIGTTDLKDLVFKTNGVERMRINANGKITSPEININKIITSRITSPDTAIHIGDSSLVFSTTNDFLYNDGKGVNKGVGIGLGAEGHSNYSVCVGFSSDAGDKITAGTITSQIAIGNRVKALGDQSMVIGTGTYLGANNTLPNYLVNNTPNSLMIGFNSNIPTIFVSQSSGLYTTGKVGIGNPSSYPGNYSLYVTGGILTEKIKIAVNGAVNWSD